MSSRSPHRHPNRVTDADLTKLLDSNPELLEHLAKIPRVDEGHDVPDTAGYSKDPGVVFIDRHLARAAPEIEGKPYKIWRRALVDHEWMEKGCIDILGMPYHGEKAAHAYASAYENRTLTRLNMVPVKYNKALKPFIKREYLERITIPPEGLDCEPYRGDDPSDMRIMAKFASLGVKDAIGKHHAAPAPVVMPPAQKINDAGIIAEIKALRGDLGAFTHSLDRLCSAIGELCKQKEQLPVIPRKVRKTIRAGRDKLGNMVALIEDATEPGPQRTQ